MPDKPRDKGQSRVEKRGDCPHADKAHVVKETLGQDEKSFRRPGRGWYQDLGQENEVHGCEKECSVTSVRICGKGLYRDGDTTQGYHNKLHGGTKGEENTNIITGKAKLIEVTPKDGHMSFVGHPGFWRGGVDGWCMDQFG